MLTKTTIALATALVLGAAGVAIAGQRGADPAEPSEKGGYRELGPGGAATQGLNPVYHSAAAAKCAKMYKSYDPSTMTFVGKDGQRHPCPG